jgi:DNA replication protein DnaC
VDALTTAAQFAATWPEGTNGNGLLLTGWLGVGKTHLAASILRDLVLNRKIKGVFYEYRELLKAIQNSYNKDVEETEASILRPVFEADLLVIDELGSSRRTDWVWEMVEHILNTRYNDHRTTIITTNYVNKAAGAPVVTEASTDAERARAAVYKETLGDRIGDRMRSRLQEMCVCVEMAGKDFREDVKKARFGFTPL